MLRTSKQHQVDHHGCATNDINVFVIWCAISSLACTHKPKVKKKQIWFLSFFIFSSVLLNFMVFKWEKNTEKSQRVPRSSSILFSWSWFFSSLSRSMLGCKDFDFHSFAWVPVRLSHEPLQHSSQSVMIAFFTISFHENAYKSEKWPNVYARMSSVCLTNHWFMSCDECS